MDYFNEEERTRQEQFAVRRDRILAPAVDFLVRHEITPNRVSIVGVLALLAVCLMPPSLAFLATLFMALYVLCDGIDGPLARRLDVIHDGGSLVDIVADQLGVVFLSAAAIHHLGAWGPAMVVFASAYLIFIALAVYGNGIGVEMRKVVRAKYLFFLLYLGSLFSGRDLVTYFCAGFALYYSVQVIDSLRRIYRFHDRKLQESREADES